MGEWNIYIEARDMNKKALKQWDRLFACYFHQQRPMPAWWYAKVRQLLARRTFEKEKWIVLEEYFNRAVSYDPNPGDNVASQLESVKAKLGFPAEA